MKVHGRQPIKQQHGSAHGDWHMVLSQVFGCDWYLPNKNIKQQKPTQHQQTNHKKNKKQTTTKNKRNKRNKKAKNNKTKNQKKT
mmetsp:Transcript_2633/g.7911  ORF Transcript_2633/g.7911 Transcript_2633/m.7911 type:complete len:84 (+) Transcript_2633:1221-1472(+)